MTSTFKETKIPDLQNFVTNVKYKTVIQQKLIVIIFPIIL